MMKCYARKCIDRKFIDNSAVLSCNSICWGGNGRFSCEHLSNCILQNNQKLFPCENEDEARELNFENSPSLELEKENFNKFIIQNYNGPEDTEDEIPGPEGAR